MRKLFRRKARLCLSKDFQRVLKQGNRWSSPYCRIYWHENPYSYGRLGVIAPKKAVKLATRRHQWKRIVKESFRLHSDRLAGYDIIVIIKQAVHDKNQLWATLALLWKKIHA